jgi:hypothetical protein
VATPAYTKGAPLHIINLTINETVAGRSQVQQQDRKGLALAVGPAGLSASARHHLLFEPHRPEPNLPTRGTPEIWPSIRNFESAMGDTDSDNAALRFRVFEYGQSPAEPTKDSGVKAFPAEAMSLSWWLGLSGAAFSTGLGYRTNVGLSLLAGLANVRLGYWWHANIDMPRREKTSVPGRPGVRLIGKVFESAFRAQKYLLSEMIARFPGVARPYWYLSDGGHFENMGGYELIRRRLQLTIIVDAEQDRDYQFGGMANLVRQARIDFGAEIEFVDRNGPVFGPLDDLKPRRKDPLRRSPATAAIATVRYADEEKLRSRPERWLVYIKPTLRGRESADVTEYAASHPAFPQQSTGDQFFDEAQWESYRRLGELIGGDVLDALREDPAGAVLS